MKNEFIEKYTPIVQNIIDVNKKFYGFANSVDWEFFEDEDIAKVGMTQSNLKLYININPVVHAYEINEPLQIEYFILHEIRHIYQRLCVNLYQTNKSKCPNIQLAQRYKFEFENYVNPYESIEEYCAQQIEFEAYVFSFTVMIYKYGKIDYIKLPDFLQIIETERYINNWLEIFKKQDF